MQQTDLLLTRIEIEEAIVGIRKDGIIHVYYKSDITINLHLQNRLKKIFSELTYNQPHLYIFEGGFNVRVTREARLNALTLNKQVLSIANVVVVNSWYQRVLAEFYNILVARGQLYKVTTDFEKGINWLNKLVEEEAA